MKILINSLKSNPMYLSIIGIWILSFISFQESPIINHNFSNHTETDDSLNIKLHLYPNPKYDKKIYSIIIDHQKIQTLDEENNKKERNLTNEEINKLKGFSTECKTASMAFFPGYLDLKTCQLLFNNRIVYQGLLQTEEMFKQTKDLINYLIEISPMEINLER